MKFGNIDIPDRQIKENHLDATSETEGHVAKAQSDGSVEYNAESIGGSGMITRGFELEYVSTTQVKVLPGTLCHGVTTVNKTSSTTLDLTVAADWYDGSTHSYDAEDWLYVGVKDNGDIKLLHDNPPIYADTAGNTDGSLLYWAGTFSADLLPTDGTGITVGDGNDGDKAKACDDSYSTYYQAAGGPIANQWIQVDFGNGNEKTIRKMTITPYQQHIKDFRLLASNTGAFGGEEVTLLDDVWYYRETDVKQTYVFSNSTAYRYYRFKHDGGYSDPMQIREWELMEYTLDNVYWRVIGAVRVDTTPEITIPFHQFGDLVMYDSFEIDVAIDPTEDTWIEDRAFTIPHHLTRLALVKIVLYYGGTVWLRRPGESLATNDANKWISTDNADEGNCASQRYWMTGEGANFDYYASGGLGYIHIGVHGYSLKGLR